MSAAETTEEVSKALDTSALPPTRPEWYPLASALRGDLRRLSSKVGTVIVRICPDDKLPAAALCRFDRDEIQLRESHWIGVKPVDVGSDEFYLKNSNVIGCIWHELGHWLFTDPNFHDWVMSFPKKHRRSAILLEESRVEALFLMWSRSNPASQGSYLLMEQVLAQSLYSVVLRDVKVGEGDEGSWRRISELMLLVWARTVGGSADGGDNSSHSEVKEIMTVLRKTLSSDHQTRASKLIMGFHRTWVPQSRYANIEPSTSSYDSPRYRHESLGCVDGHTLRKQHSLVAQWVALMEEVEADQPKPDPKPDDPTPDDPTPGEESDEPGEPTPGGEEEQDDTGGDEGGEGGEGEGEGEEEGDPNGGDSKDSEDTKDGDDETDGENDGKSEDTNAEGGEESESKGEGQGHSNDTAEEVEQDAPSKSDLDKLFDKLKDEPDNGIDYNRESASKSRIKDALGNISKADAGTKIYREQNKQANQDMWF